jgi:hypothetical protein
MLDPGGNLLAVEIIAIGVPDRNVVAAKLITGIVGGANATNIAIMHRPAGT